MILRILVYKVVTKRFEIETPLFSIIILVDFISISEYSGVLHRMLSRVESFPPLSTNIKINL